MKTLRKKIFFSVMTFTSIIILIELFLQLLAAFSPKIDYLFLNHDYYYAWPVKDDKLGSRPSPFHPEHDNNGFRNREIPVTADIVALGDSNTYGFFVDREEAWPQQLESISKLTIYNMGFATYGPTHSLMLWDEAKKLHPKIIIEAFYSGNDLYDSYRHVYILGQFERMKRNNPDVLKIADEEIKELNPLAKKHDLSILRQLTNAIHKTKLLGLWETTKPLIKRMVQLVLPQRIVNEVSDIQGNLNWDSIKKQAKEPGDILEMPKYRTVFESKDRLSGLDTNRPHIKEGLRISLEAIEKMHDLAIRDNIHFIVLLIPTKELAFKEIIQGGRINMPKSYQDLIIKEELFWTKAKGFFKEREIDFIDSLPVMRECLLDGKQPYVISFDGHLNKIGHNKIAELINDYIYTQSILNK